MSWIISYLLRPTLLAFAMANIALISLFNYFAFFIISLLYPAAQFASLSGQLYFLFTLIGLCLSALSAKLLFNTVDIVQVFSFVNLFDIRALILIQFYRPVIIQLCLKRKCLMLVLWIRCFTISYIFI